MDKVRIGDICTVVSGSTPKSNIEEYWNGDIKWITPAEITDDSYVISDTERHITEKAVEKTNLTLLPVGTVLLSSRAPIGKTAIVGAEMYCNQGFKNLICSERIYNKYLYFFLTSKVDYLNALGRGATFKEISKGIVEDVEIPLPSLDEQKKIAERFEAIQQLLNKRKQALLYLDNIVKSRFIEMFGDPVMNPMGWEVKKLKDLSLKISDGVHAKPNYTEDGKPFISVVNITTGHIDFSNCKFVSQEDYEKMIKSTHPEKGDVLYTKVGATYGIPAYVDTDEDFCLYVSVCLIKPKHELVNARFLTESMRLPYIKHQADRRIRGIGVPDLHLNQIREFDIVCPPLDLQERYMEFVDLVDKSKLAVQQSIETLQTLKAKLMQDYFG